MRKLGFILPFVIAAAAAFGAEPEKKAPEAAKPAEVKEPAKKAEEPKAAEKKAEAPAKAKAAKTAEKKTEAPAKKVEPIGTPIPWFVPEKAQELDSDIKFKVPPEGIRTKADLKAGESRSFILKENAGGTWVVNAVNDKVATVKKIAYDDGGWFCDPAATFEITAVHPGRTLLEMTQVDYRNAPLRAFRCYIEVK